MNHPRLLHHILLHTLLGILLTYLSAWACTLWSPNSPAYSSSSSVPAAFDLSNDPDPDLQARSTHDASFRFGWAGNWQHYTDLPIIQVSGFPCYALYSRVNRIAYYNDQSWPTRWDLPPSEILSRGLNSYELPQFLHAHWHIRLALLPLFPGFLLNALFYAAITATLHRVLLPSLRKNLQARSSGFPVLSPPNSP